VAIGTAVALHWAESPSVGVQKKEEHMTHARSISTRSRARNESSSDRLGRSSQEIVWLLRDGLRRASPGALFVVGFCLSISVVAIIARTM